MKALKDGISQSGCEDLSIGDIPGPYLSLFTVQGQAKLSEKSGLDGPGCHRGHVR